MKKPKEFTQEQWDALTNTTQKSILFDELNDQLAEYQRKIQDWWWRLNDMSTRPVPTLYGDMEAFMRQHNIPLEKPQ